MSGQRDAGRPWIAFGLGVLITIALLGSVARDRQQTIEACREAVAASRGALGMAAEVFDRVRTDPGADVTDVAARFDQVRPVLERSRAQCEADG